MDLHSKFLSGISDEFFSLINFNTLNHMKVSPGIHSEEHQLPAKFSPNLPTSFRENWTTMGTGNLSKSFHLKVKSGPSKKLSEPFVFLTAFTKKYI